VLALGYNDRQDEIRVALFRYLGNVYDKMNEDSAMMDECAMKVAIKLNQMEDEETSAADLLKVPLPSTLPSNLYNLWNAKDIENMTMALKYSDPALRSGVIQLCNAFMNARNDWEQDNRNSAYNDFKELYLEARADCVGKLGESVLKANTALTMFIGSENEISAPQYKKFREKIKGEEEESEEEKRRHRKW
jgi:hypothetical protein